MNKIPFLYLRLHNKSVTNVIKENIDELFQYNRYYLKQNTLQNGIYLQHINYIFPDKLHHYIHNHNLLNDKMLICVEKQCELNNILSKFKTQMEEDINKIIEDNFCKNHKQIQNMNYEIDKFLYDKSLEFIMHNNHYLRLSNRILNDTYENIGSFHFRIKLTPKKLLFK